jgi:hypothetical protein
MNVAGKRRSGDDEQWRSSLERCEMLNAAMR